MILFNTLQYFQYLILFQSWQGTTPISPPRKSGNAAVNAVAAKRRTIVVNVHLVETIKVIKSANFAGVIV